MASNFYEITYNIKHFDNVYQQYVTLWKKREADVKSRGGSMGDALYTKAEFAEFYAMKRREQDGETSPGTIIKSLVQDQQYHVSEKQARKMKEAAKRLGIKNITQIGLREGGKELAQFNEALKEIQKAETDIKAEEYRKQGYDIETSYKLARRDVAAFIAFTYFGSE